MHLDTPALLRVGTAGLALLLGLSACSTSTPPHSSNAPHSSPGESVPSSSGSPVEFAKSATGSLVWADGTKVKAKQQDLGKAREAVEGSDFQKVFSASTQQRADHEFIPLSIDSAGVPIGLYGPAAAIADYAKDGTRIGPGELNIGRYDSGTFQPFTTQGAAKKKYTPMNTNIAISVSDVGIFWSESTEGDTEDTDWRILYAPRGSTEVTVLASKKDLKAGDQSDEYQFVLSPLVLGNRVYWEYYQYQHDEGTAINKVFSVDLNTPGVVREDIGNSVEGPSGNAGWWGDGLLSSALLEKDTDSGLVETFSSYSLAGKRKEVLYLREDPAEPSHATQIGTNKPYFSLTHAESVFLVDTAKREALVFSGPKDSQVSGATHCGSRLSWTFINDGAEYATERYIFDSERNELLLVSGAQDTGSSWCTGEYLGVTVLDSAGAPTVVEDLITRWER